MKSSIKVFFKNNSIIFISSLVVFVFMFAMLIVNGIEPFGNNSLVQYDCLHQYYPFLSVLYDKLKSGESLYYYWNSGLGSNYFLNYISQLPNPLNLMVIFVKKEHITTFITILIVFKMVLSAGTFSFFLLKRRNEPNKFMILSMSVSYALSNYAIGYSHELMWLDAYILLPVIIYGFEILLRERRPFLYILSLAFCAFCNLYPVLFIGIFLILLFFFYEHKSIKDFFINGFTFAGASILAAGMASFTLVLSFINISGTYVESDVMDGHMWYGNIFEVIRYQFIFSNPITVSYKFNQANLYCGTFAIIMAFIFVFTKSINISEKIKYVSLLAFMILSMNESILNYLWHGMHFQTGVPNRFSFLFVFVLLTVSYETICKLDKENMKGVIVGTVFAEFFPMISFFFVENDSYISSNNILIISLIIVLIYVILILLFCFQNNRNKVFISLLSVAIILEVTINSIFAFRESLVGDISLYNSKSIYNAVDVIKLEDDFEVTRSEIADQGLNMNAIYGLKGIGIFSSWYPYENCLYMYGFGEGVSANSIRVLSFSEPLEDLLGLRYIVSMEDGIKYDSKKNYSKIYDQDGVKVYKNLNAMPIIYASSDKIKSFSMDSLWDVYGNIDSFAYGICGENGLCEEIHPGYDVYSKNCELVIEDTADLEFQYFAEIPENREIWFDFSIPQDGDYNCYLGTDGNYYDLTVFVNDEIVFEQSAQESNMFSIGERSKNDEVEVVIRGVSDKVGMMPSANSGMSGFLVARINEDVLNDVITYARDNSFEIEEFKDGYIKGSISLDSDQVLFSSIPYDSSWHAYDNGNEVRIENYAGFMGLDIGEGQHDLVFEYIPVGVDLAIIVTGLSWILFLVLVIMLRRINSSKKKEEPVQKEYDENN